ncbi:unnamed protein product [Aphis gossypii]|uniref:Transposable element P transposase-like RNase H domain-containing protein n=1 Tax=Aphis gossypii TaxID=80765 RepID=A0A9P0IN89_APHGO|nr:unnamed protein product [Aphis gossypii]
MLHKRNLNCSIIIPHGYYCFPCARTRKMLKQRSARLVAQCSPKRVTLKMTPKSKKKLSLLQKRNELLRKQKKNCINKIKLLRQNMSELMSKFENVSKESISQKLTEMNCSGYQKTIIEEIVSAAKISNPKGRRYSDEWIMLCMLLHIRTPSGYNFCKKNDILPLPSVSSLRRYLAMIDTACGFDKNFFTLFKKHLERKTTMQKHGIILVDEISVREALTVCSKTLTYKGLVDYGEEYKATDINEKATSGLVFMFQPLADTYCQPVAVFAAKGSVVGTELAKLVIKCIILLEQAGAIVHGVVSDGAQTNRKMWSELGVSGELKSFKNWFPHPLVDDRKIYVFSDTPHLFKNVRNKLYNDKVLKFTPNKSGLPQHIKMSCESTS